MCAEQAAIGWACLLRFKAGTGRAPSPVLSEAGAQRGAGPCLPRVARALRALQVHGGTRRDTAGTRGEQGSWRPALCPAYCPGCRCTQALGPAGPATSVAAALAGLSFPSPVPASRASLFGSCFPGAMEMGCWAEVPGQSWEGSGSTCCTFRCRHTWVSLLSL